MKIAEVIPKYYRIPLPTPFSNSTHGIIADFELITVQIKDDQGIEGLGYTYTVGKGGESIFTMVEKNLKPYLLGQDPGRIEQLWSKMWWLTHYVGRGGVAAMAISPVDIALWDLKGKRFQEPLWRLLGGYNPRIPIYPGGIDLDFSLDALKEQMRGFLARAKFKGIKMKVGRQKLSEDVERVAAIRDLIGPDIHLLADANNGWTVEKALRASRSLAEFDLFWLEEPTIPDDLEGHVKIAKEGPLPVAVGESLRTIYDFRKYIEAEAASFLMPDVSNLGGITPWMKVAHMAEARNILVSSHGVHDFHVHTLAAIPNSSYLEEHGFGLEKFIKEPLRIEDGLAIAPDRPGHGVELDWGKMKPHLLV